MQVFIYTKKRLTKQLYTQDADSLFFPILRVLSRESTVLTATDLKMSLNQFQQNLQENLFQRTRNLSATAFEENSEEEQIENTEEVVIHGKKKR